MKKITAIFWDLGGVILTNAWDRDQRVKVLAEFGIASKKELDEFGDRHREVAASFEVGRCSLDQYLELTLFGYSRHFSVQEFKQKMFEQSQALPGFEVLKELSAKALCLLATLNNESRELNEYRIQRFELKKHFQAFFSSCYLNTMKPNSDIYGAALSITQRRPDECLFIDDRLQNVEAARRCGLHAIHYLGPDQLREQLAAHGVMN